MSIQSEITRISGNISDALGAVEEKGVNVPAGSTSDDLPSLIRSIQIPDSTRKRLIYYGTSSTAAGTQAKTATVPDVTELYEGLYLRIKFANNQTYNGVPTLNVNSLGAKNICRRSGTNAARYEWKQDEILDLMYDGTQFVIIDGETATTDYFGYTKLNSSVTSTSTSTALTPAAMNNFAQNMISGVPVYSASSTYSVGDKVRYSTYIYECIVAITTAEAWNASHWQALDPLLTQIDDLKESIESIPKAATSNPLSDNVEPSIGNSTKYAKEDHRHPFSYWTYQEDTGSFLDWCSTTFTNNGSYYVVFASNNVSGWPNINDPTGVANVVKRNNNIYIFATTDSMRSYKIMRYSDGTWEPAWHEIPSFDDVPAASSNVPLADSGSGSIGSSYKYAREDHVHPSPLNNRIYSDAISANGSLTVDKIDGHIYLFFAIRGSQSSLPAIWIADQWGDFIQIHSSQLASLSYNSSTKKFTLTNNLNTYINAGYICL